MGLFDDILKKPVNQTPPNDPLGSNMGSQGAGQGGYQGGSQPPQTNPTGTIFIQKSSEEIVFGPESEAISIEKENAPSPMPTVHAEADTSSILISTPTPVMIESMSMMSAPVGPVEPLVVLNSESTLYATAPSPAPSEPMITPVQVTQDPIMVVAPTLIIDSVAPTPVVTNSIFDSIMSPGEPAPAMIPQEIIPVAITPAPVVVAPSAPLSGAPVVFSSTHNFSTPREFIEKSIANIDTMLVNIDGRHTAKEIEEESYRIEKLRFTDLEKNAHTEKIIMDKETDHAIHMRKILETELERDKANKATEETHANHVESTLTEIGTEHPVHRHAHKKTDPHLHEESPVIA